MKRPDVDGMKTRKYEDVKKNQGTRDLDSFKGQENLDLGTSLLQLLAQVNDLSGVVREMGRAAQECGEAVAGIFQALSGISRNQVSFRLFGQCVLYHGNCLQEVFDHLIFGRPAAIAELKWAVAYVSS